MKCLFFFGMSSMKEGTSAQLSGRGELHGGARVTTLVTLRKCTLGNKREIKTLKFVLASTKGFKGGLAWIKPSKKDMAVTFSYSLQQGPPLDTATTVQQKGCDGTDGAELDVTNCRAVAWMAACRHLARDTTGLRQYRQTDRTALASAVAAVTMGPVAA